MSRSQVPEICESSIINLLEVLDVLHHKIQSILLLPIFNPSSQLTSNHDDDAMAGTMTEPVDALIGPKLIALNWSMTGVAALVVGLRISEKFRKRCKLWWDDYVAIVSWVSRHLQRTLRVRVPTNLSQLTLQTLLLGLSISLTFEVKKGLGRHMSELHPMALEGFVLESQLSSTIAIAGTSLAKVAFAVNLLKYSEGRLRRLVLLIIVLVNAVSGVSGTVLWVQCTPLRKNFIPTSPGSCFPGATRVAIQILNTCK